MRPALSPSLSQVPFQCNDASYNLMPPPAVNYGFAQGTPQGEVPPDPSQVAYPGFYPSQTPATPYVAPPFSYPAQTPLKPFPGNVYSQAYPHSFPPFHAPVPAQPAPPAPQPAPTPPAAAPIPAAQRGPTVYIGHLTHNTDDMVIRQLLQECGRVVRWSRTTNPSTKKLSTFGFCEFESPLGVIRAVRCLDGLVLDGQKLVANCEDKLKDGLEIWRRDRKNKLLEENPSKSLQEVEFDIENEELRIQQITQKIAGDWNAKMAESETEPGQYQSASSEPQEAKQASTPDAESIQQKLRLQRLEALPKCVDPPKNMAVSSRAALRLRNWNNRIREGKSEFRRRLQTYKRNESHFLASSKKHRHDLKELIKNPCIVSSSDRKKLIDMDCRGIPYYLTNIWKKELTPARLAERAHLLEKERAEDQKILQALSDPVFEAKSPPGADPPEKLEPESQPHVEDDRDSLSEASPLAAPSESAQSKPSSPPTASESVPAEKVYAPIQISLSLAPKKAQSDSAADEEAKLDSTGVFAKYEDEDEDLKKSADEFPVDRGS